MGVDQSGKRYLSRHYKRCSWSPIGRKIHSRYSSGRRLGSGGFYFTFTLKRDYFCKMKRFEQLRLEGASFAPLPETELQKSGVRFGYSSTVQIGHPLPQDFWQSSLPCGYTT